MVFDSLENVQNVKSSREKSYWLFPILKVKVYRIPVSPNFLFSCLGDQSFWSLEDTQPSLNLPTLVTTSNSSWVSGDGICGIGYFGTGFKVP